MNPVELVNIVGAEHVLSGEEAAAYSVGGVLPAAVAAPGTREEAAAVIRHAAEAGWALVPYGGGTRIETGFPPQRLDLVLSTRRLDRVVDYQPDDMTVTVEPGVRMSVLAELLSTRGQLLPIDPPLPERATVGGTVAAAVSGPSRAGFGAPRDWVIGCRVVGVDGQEVRGGGLVVKNVAGYDLPKLYTGSYGTLGLLTEVTFKVMPRPPAEGYCCVGGLTVASTETLLAQVLHSDLQPTMLELKAVWQPSAAPEWRLYFQFLHAPEAVAWQIRRLAELAGAAGGSLEEYAPEAGALHLQLFRDAPGRHPFVARLGTTSSRVVELAARVADLCRGWGSAPQLFARASHGVVYLCAEDAADGAAEALRSLGQEFQAVCVFERLPPALVGRVDPWGDAGPELRLMRGLKEALDPNGLFSPGRFVGGL